MYMRLDEQALLPEGHDATIQKLAKSQKLLAFSKESKKEDAKRYQLLRKADMDYLAEMLVAMHAAVMESPAYLKQEADAAIAVASLSILSDLLEGSLDAAKANNTRRAGEWLDYFLNEYVSKKDLIEAGVPRNGFAYMPVFMRKLEERWAFGEK